MTALSGLPSYLELVYALALGKMISGNVKARKGNQGCTDEQMVMSLTLLLSSSPSEPEAAMLNPLRARRLRRLSYPINSSSRRRTSSFP
jgi:hypothetical protein